VEAANRAVEIAELQYRGGTADYTRVLDTQQLLLQEQDRLVSSKGLTALNLVNLYRALGGGWELRQGQPPIPDRVREEMRARTNWGDLLPAGNASGGLDNAPAEAAPVGPGK